MKKYKVIFESLLEFLPILNLYIDENDKENIKDILLPGNKLILYDECLNPVGYVYKQKDEVYIEADFKNYTLSANGFFDNDLNFCYKYTLKSDDNKNKIKGFYRETKSGDKTNLEVENTISFYDKHQRVAKCSFSTLKNKFSLYNDEKDSKAIYKNNAFLHSDNEKTTEIVNELGNIYYKTIYHYKLNKIDILGFSRVIVPKNSGAYSMYEAEIRKILNDIDCEYFDFIKEQKEIFNSMQSNLFEKTARSSLKQFSKRQLKDMLDIDCHKIKKAKIKKIS